MKAVVSVTLLLIVIAIAVIASLTLFDLLAIDQTIDYGIKSIGSIIILGIASTLIALLSSSSKK